VIFEDGAVGEIDRARLAGADDADRVAACFAKRALVADEGREFRGRRAVREWAQEVRRKYRFNAEVVAAAEIAEQIVVTAHLAGNFPGSPVDLKYRFTLDGDAIVALKIG
jgi:predicted GNAT family acetyltransferase